MSKRRKISKRWREAAAIACSMMACAWATTPDTVAEEWRHFERVVKDPMGLALYEAAERKELASIARGGRAWPPHVRFAEMEALLRRGWRPRSVWIGYRGGWVRAS